MDDSSANERKTEIQNQLVDFFISNDSDSIDKKYYNPLNKYGEQLSHDYLINSDQFFDCYGKIKNPSDLSLGDISINEMYNKHQRDSLLIQQMILLIKHFRIIKIHHIQVIMILKWNLKDLKNLNNREIHNSK